MEKMEELDMQRISHDIHTFFGKHSASIQNPFIKSAIVSILDECLEQFCILKSLNLRNAIIFDYDVAQYKSLKERYTGEINHAFTRIPLKTVNYDKIAIDINKLINIIRQTSAEVNEKGTYEVLARCTKTIRQMLKDDYDLLKNKVENEKQIEELRNRYEEERVYNNRTIEETNDKIQKLRFEVANAAVFSNQKLKYYAFWEQTRIEQNSVTCNEKEKVYNNILNETTHKILLETNCHNEFITYIEEDRNDCIEQINYWVKRYDEEIEARESDMIQMKTKLEEMSRMHAQIIEEHKKRQEEMVSWKLYKKDKKRRLARERDVRWASLIIQTWWRGIMTRKGFGPYKFKKGKK